METHAWPSWLKEIYPNWLENIGYPFTGVGDLGDLKLGLGVGQDGRWIGFVNPGWYYHDNKEQYSYVKVGTISVTGVVSGTVTEPISFRPSWGPVLVHGVSDDASGVADGPYKEHHNSYFPAYNAGGNLWSFFGSWLYLTIPASCVVVGVRDLSNNPLGAVDSLAGLTSDKLYYWDQGSASAMSYYSRRVYIKPTQSFPAGLHRDVWVDLLYTTPQLKFREVVMCEEDASGNLFVRPSYQGIENLTMYRGAVELAVSGYIASGVINHTLSGTAKDDWVVLSYNISKSFVLTKHNELKYFCGGSAGSGVTDVFNIYYETSIPDVLPNITVNTPSSGIYPVFNMNPMFEHGYRTGYLFHGTPASGINSYWVPHRMTLFADKSTVCGTWAELVNVKMYVTADNDLPLPYYNVSVTVSGGTAILQLPNNRTDGKGEMRYIIRPNATGSTGIIVRATCGTLTASAVISIVASSSLIDINKWVDGFVNIVVTNDRTGRGGFRTYANTTYADGLPRDGTINLTSKLASEFHLGSGRTYTKKVSLTSAVTIPNIAALSEFGYVPQTNDKLFGYSNTAISRLIAGEA